MTRTSKKSFGFSTQLLLKTITVLFTVLTANTQQALGQLSDNFSDNDLSANPAWSGTVTSFTVNSSQQLQLNSSVAATSYLSTPFSTALGDVTWQFYVKQTFAASATNYGRVYLASNQPDLTSALNGYYVQFGESGSNDAVELFRQSGLTSVSVCRGTNGAIAGSFAAGIKVTRSQSGEWSLFADYAGQTNFVLQATGTDNTHMSSAFFGVRCTYTATNANKFFYDDFSIMALAVIDTTPPALSQVAVLSATELLVSFSEPMKRSAAENPSNYSVGGSIMPSAAILQENNSSVKLDFAVPFGNGMDQMLSVANLEDLAGNVMQTASVGFRFFQPVRPTKKSIVICEIMADPVPTVGLPEAEYVELYNRSGVPFDLKDWRISDGNTTANLSTFMIRPGEHAILVPANQLALFSAFEKKLGVAGMPSLNNTTDIIRLSDPEGNTIDSLTYSNTWYGDEEKEDGGWALELIDPDDQCKGAANWSASVDPRGGSPGMQNSIFSSTPDISGPKLLEVAIKSDSSVDLVFDEKLSPSSLSGDFSLEPIMQISSARFVDDFLTKIELGFVAALDSATTYTVMVGGVLDCPGNLLQEEFATATFKLDAVAPVVLQVVVASGNTLNVFFSEEMNADAARNSSYYRVDQSVYPQNVSLSADGKSVTLQFAEAFTNGVEKRLLIEGPSDRAGNVMLPVEKRFLFFERVQANYKDIVISEIMADPSPPVQLPEAEYIELYKRSDAPFDLLGWMISDGTGHALLPARILLPGHYLVLCSSSRASLFPTPSTTGVVAFPSLSNNGESISLRDNNGMLIDSVNYDDGWHADRDKQDGGWALELIDPNNVCSEKANWTSSTDGAGGTPGRVNSVKEEKPDLTGPKLVTALAAGPDMVMLEFNEKLDKNLPFIENIVFEPEMNILGISFSDRTLTKLRVELELSLQKSVEYRISLKDIFDCAGNEIAEEFRSASFALPQAAEPGDVVINEILFNPTPTGVDFVEVVNRSEKFIDLKGWQIANIENGSPANTKVISAGNRLLRPNEFALLTEDGIIVKSEYIRAREETFIQTDLPSFPDDEGSVLLLNEGYLEIDQLIYSGDFHSPFLKDPEGVSLERIHAAVGTAAKENWKSASTHAGSATPGYENSNVVPEVAATEAITVEPEIFIPNGGQGDFAQIHYNFETGGYVANVKILDARGMEVKLVASSQLLGTDGFFRWDGDDDNGGKARVGSYMVWFEVFDAGGDVRTFRKRVAIAARF